MSAPCYETLLFDHADGAYRLTLNRPERLNALTALMQRELLDAVAQVEADPGARVLLITGAGRGFCAGQDLGERDVSAGPLDLGVGPETFYNPFVRKLAALPLPVVCGVNGVAAGAGVNIALACDIVLARAGAKFAQAFSAIGLVPDAGGSWILPRLAGQARALGFTLTNATITAEEAQAWGMIWRAVPDEAFPAELDALVASLAQAPTAGLGAAKRAIRAAGSSSMDAHLDLERDLQRACGRTADYAEGVTAFKEKRPPRFQGR